MYSTIEKHIHMCSTIFRVSMVYDVMPLRGGCLTMQLIQSVSNIDNAIEVLRYAQRSIEFGVM